MVVIWITASLFLILSILLLSGRGGFLISGYNTASPEKKARYDEKKLCRVTGAGMLVITIMLFIMAAFDEILPNWFAGLFMIVTFVDTIVMMVVSNTMCYAKNLNGSLMNISEAEFTEADIKRNKMVTKWSLIFTALVFIIVGIFLVTGDINFSCEEEQLVIKASYYTDMIIDYDKIQELEYREGYLKGSRTGGFGSFRLLMGNFENKEFGNYTRYTYTDCHGYIVLTIENKKNPVIIAGENKEETEVLYSKLMEKVE